MAHSALTNPPRLPKPRIVQPLAAIELLLLQDRTAPGPELHLVPGRVLAARVVAPQTPNMLGKLAMAGMTLEATLPSHLRAGDEVRVAVRDVTPQRLTLSLIPPPAVPPAHVPLPGGGTLSVSERQAQRDAQDEIAVTSLTLRYEAPHLGAVDLHFQLSPAGLQLSLRGAPGAPLELMRAHLNELRAALQPTALALGPRRDLSTYA
jgi:hypothetical protein